MKQTLGIVAVVLAILVGVSGTLSFAQQKQSSDRATVERVRVTEGQPAPEGDVVFFNREVQGPEGPPPPGMPADFVFVANEMNFFGKVTKGAPYSAQAVTETVQTLGDGNRIVNKSTSAIYRDSEGRTRREQSLRLIGGFANGGEAPQTIFINDPVAGTSYSLDSRTHIAHQMPPMNFTFQTRVPAPVGGKPGGEGEVQMTERVGAERFEFERGQVMSRVASDTLVVRGLSKQATAPESLGRQSIEGVEAEGTRNVITIPAGEIGNERPIEIVDERWYSAELQTVVMTRHSDPRFGESTYRLMNIDRSEPAKSLFEVPADYTLKTGSFGRGESFGFGTAAGVGGGDGIRVSRVGGTAGGGVLNGRAITLPRPAYPASAKQANASGNVTVEVTIDEEGNVTSAKAVSGHPLLQAAAVTAAREAKFSPTKTAGQAVKVKGVLVYSFRSE